MVDLQKELDSQSEEEIKKDILLYLKTAGVCHWRNNSGGVHVRGRYVKYGFPGSPDIISIIRGRFVGIEVKNRTEPQSGKQEEFEEECKIAKGIYIVARSLAFAILAVNTIQASGSISQIEPPKHGDGEPSWVELAG